MSCPYAAALLNRQRKICHLLCNHYRQQGVPEVERPAILTLAYTDGLLVYSAGAKKTSTVKSSRML